MNTNLLRILCVAVLAVGCGRSTLRTSVSSGSSPDARGTVGDGGPRTDALGFNTDGGPGGSVGDGGFTNRDGSITDGSLADVPVVVMPSDAFPLFRPDFGFSVDLPPPSFEVGVARDVGPPPVVLVSVSVTPALTTAALNTTTPFTAAGVYSNGTRTDVTAMATWTSTNPAVASVEMGVAKAIGPGTAIIRATIMGQSGQGTLTVTGATVTSLSVEPVDGKVAVNGQLPFKAIGTLSDGTKQDLSSSAMWASSDAAIASVSLTGTVTGLRAGSAAITATAMALSGKATVTVTTATLNTIEVSPTNPILPVPGMQTFKATGIYSDGSNSDLTSQVTWSVSNPAVLNISNLVGSQGMATTTAPGMAVVTATLGTQSGTTSVTVGSAVLMTIGVTPGIGSAPRGTTQVFKATGAYSDGTMQDITNTVAWSAVNGAVASVSNVAPTRGLATGLTAGTTAIQATLNGVTGTAQLTVSDATATTLTIAPKAGTVANATKSQYTATAMFSDGSNKDVTTLTSWSTADATVAVVSNSAGSIGELTALKGGATDVTGTFQGKTDTARVTVSNATLASISIMPATAMMVSGQRQNLTAQGILSDGTMQDLTTQVTWSSENTMVATASNATGAKGQVTAVAAGTTNIKASFSGKDGTAMITVSVPTLSSLSVGPILPTRRLGQNVNFSASAIFSNGTSMPVTLTTAWTSSNMGVATIAMNGQATCVAQGTTTITGVYMAVMDSTTLTCSNPTIVSVQVTPLLGTLRVGQTQPYSLTALFSDGTSQNVGNMATWTSSNPGVADVSTAMFRGLVRGISAGTAAIKGEYMGFMDSTNVTVLPAATLVSVSLSPPVLTLRIAQTQALTATGVMSDGSTQNLTNQCTFVSDMQTIADVTNGGGGGGFGGFPGFGGRGQVTAVAAGTAKITATCMGLSDTATVHVSAATLTSVSVAPINPSIRVAQTIQLAATGIYSDGTSSPITTMAVWSTSNAAIADVSNAVGGGFPFPGGAAGTGRGSAVGIAPGTVTITATFMGLTDTTTLTVTPATLSSLSVSPVLGAVRVGETTQFQATAVYSDGTSQNVTAMAVWTSSNMAVADVSNGTGGGFPGGGGGGLGGGRGVTTGIAVGTATIKATFMTVSDQATVTVTAPTLTTLSITPPGAMLVINQTQQLQATTVYSDGTSANETFAATWTSSNMAVADVSNGGGGPGGGGGRGAVTALTAGTTTITASYMGKTASVTITVTSANITSISLTPVNVKMAVNDTQAFQATAIYDNGTSQNVTGMATWVSSDMTIADVSNGFGGLGGGGRGTVTALKPGTATITATFMTFMGSTTVTVTSATVTSIQVTPTNPTVLIGGGLNFAATVIYSDFTSENVTNTATWTSSSATVAAVSNGFGSRGRATGVASGTATITATYMGAMGSTTLTVTSATIASIQVTPTNPTSPTGVKVPFKATALLSDNTSQDVTAASTFTSSDGTVASVSNTNATRGQATATKAGTTTIKATVNGMSGQTTYTVGAQKLMSIAVMPGTAMVAKGATQLFTAIGTYDDATTYDISSYATWISGTPGTATVSTADGSRGLVTGVATGMTNINAYLDAKMGTAVVTVP